MTMPSLIQNAKKKETSARLKKFYSMIGQAIIMSELDNGPIEDWRNVNDYIINEDGSYDAAANSEISDAFFRKFLAPYLTYVSAEKDPSTSYYTKVILADGSLFHVRNGGGCYDIWYDVNGDKKPNKMGRDKFFMVICSKKYITPGNGYWGAFCPKNLQCATRDKAIQSCKTNSSFCAGILQLDNWEIRDDYPFRI